MFFKVSFLGFTINWNINLFRYAVISRIIFNTFDFFLNRLIAKTILFFNYFDFNIVYTFNNLCFLDINIFNQHLSYHLHSFLQNNLSEILTLIKGVIFDYFETLWQEYFFDCGLTKTRFSDFFNSFLECNFS